MLPGSMAEVPAGAAEQRGVGRLEMKLLLSYGDGTHQEFQTQATTDEIAWV